MKLSVCEHDGCPRNQCLLAEAAKDKTSDYPAWEAWMNATGCDCPESAFSRMALIKRAAALIVIVADDCYSQKDHQLAETTLKLLKEGCQLLDRRTNR